MKTMHWNLQLFAEEGAIAATDAAAGAGTTTAAETGTQAPITTGQTLSDGSRVQDARVAAALEKQMKRHPELREVYLGQGKPQQGKRQAAQTERPAGTQQPGQGAGASADPTRQQRWEELKKGEFAEMYGQDVQKAIQERFKNQADANEQLKKLAPMLEVLRGKAGVENDEDLVKAIMDDDSLYEEEAEQKGMTVESLKLMKSMEKELSERRAAEEQSVRDQMLQQHFGKLVQQSNELRRMIPDFDLRSELQNNADFRRLTSPEVGVSVEDAYFAVHHKEMMPRALAAGMQRAQQQMGQTIQAQGRRPAEGAMKGGNKAANDIKINPAALSRKERAKFKEMAARGITVSFD